MIFTEIQGTYNSKLNRNLQFETTKEKAKGGYTKVKLKGTFKYDNKKEN